MTPITIIIISIVNTTITMIDIIMIIIIIFCLRLLSAPRIDSPSETVYRSCPFSAFDIRAARNCAILKFHEDI